MRRRKNPNESALFDHISQTDHYAGFDDFETLVKESVEFRLLLRDLFLIRRDDLPLTRYFNPEIIRLGFLRVAFSRVVAQFAHPLLHIS